MTPSPRFLAVCKSVGSAYVRTPAGAYWAPVALFDPGASPRSLRGPGGFPRGTEGLCRECLAVSLHTAFRVGSARVGIGVPRRRRKVA